MTDKVNEQAGKHLGRHTEYRTTYAPEVLNPIDRQLNREQYNIDSKYLPFIGYDVWNIYEIGFLTENGLPVIGAGKIIYPANTQYMIESKSMKLYFFSHNMMRYGKTPEEGISLLEGIVRKDISNAIQGPVEFRIITNMPHSSHRYGNEWLMLEQQLYDDLNIQQFTTFKEDPSLLKTYKSESNNIFSQVRTGLLRSNCRVTSQPDWGDLFVKYRGPKALDLISFMQYVVSFRGENHFHEEVVEMIYKRLLDVLTPTELLVTALYTRRGGIDINPTRATSEKLFEHDALIDIEQYVEKTLRQ